MSNTTGYIPLDSFGNARKSAEDRDHPPSSGLLDDGQGLVKPMRSSPGGEAAEYREYDVGDDRVSASSSKQR